MIMLGENEKNEEEMMTMMMAFFVFMRC